MRTAPPAEDELSARLRALAARRAGVRADEVTVSPTSSGALLAFAPTVVVKAHRIGTDPAALGARLRLAADPAWADVLLAPLEPVPTGLRVTSGPDRVASVWPRARTVPRRPGRVPWAAAGERLARLHSRPAPGVGELPPHGAAQRVRLAVADLDALGGLGADLAAARALILAAAAGLPAAALEPGPAGRPRTLVHGDWHLGQLARAAGGARGTWVLLDPDDLGLGDPAWDFARPAAMLAAGVLSGADWRTFVDAYRDAAGPALPASPAEPWPAVDAVARAGVVQGAAAVIRRAARGQRPLDAVDRALVNACAAIR